MSCHQYTAVDELRRWTRFCNDSGEAFAVIWRSPSDEMLAEVHDESLGGIALILDDVDHFGVGQEAELIYAGDYLHVSVCHIEPCSDGRFLVGFEADRISWAIA